jgi:splicing factor 3B subunit 2
MPICLFWGKKTERLAPNIPAQQTADRLLIYCLKRKKPGDIDVALDPGQLEEDGLTSEAIKRRYEIAQEEQRRERQGSQFQEDLSDMIAQESRKRQKREEENAKRKKEKYRF